MVIYGAERHPAFIRLENKRKCCLTCKKLNADGISFDTEYNYNCELKEYNYNCELKDASTEFGYINNSIPYDKLLEINCYRQYEKYKRGER